MQRRWPEVENRTDLLNFLVVARGYRRYLEIGVRNPRGTFSRVRAAEKTGIDPAPRGKVDFRMTSDDFFAGLAEASERAEYDLILIDGLHVDEQVERDVENSLRHLAAGGAIVLHDCNPQTRDAQMPSLGDRAVWNGTVWKAWLKLRSTRSDLTMAVVDIDHGCGLIMRGQQARYPLTFTSYDELDYAVLERDRDASLNLISATEFMTKVVAP